MLYNNNYPISGQDMIYNESEHMYILTKDYVLQKTGVDLTPLIDSPYIADKTTAVNNMLADISMQLYLFVYSYNSRYNDYQEYLMAKSPMARDLIRKALLKQLSYIMRNGKINEFAGTNTSFNANNASTPLEELRGERSIHPEAVQILNRPLENGEKILFNGDYYLPWNIEYRQGY